MWYYLCRYDNTPPEQSVDFSAVQFVWEVKP